MWEQTRDGGVRREQTTARSLCPLQRSAWCGPSPLNTHPRSKLLPGRGRRGTMPWPLSWLRRKKRKDAAQGCNVDVEAIRAEPGSAKMPGVGIIDRESTRKTTHKASVVMHNHQEQTLPSADGLQRSTVCPRAALVKPNNALSITELRLGPNKGPCCIILTEDVESYSPPKPCRSSR